MKGGILLICVLVTLGICINYAAADEIEFLISFQPSNLVISEGTADITVTASNSSGYLKDHVIDFGFDNSTLGYVTPSSDTTDSDGKAFSKFYATTHGGVGNLTITVHYFEGGLPKEDSTSYKIQVIPYPDFIKIETRDVNTDAEKKWVVANGNDKAKVSVWPINTSSGYQIPYLNTVFSILPAEMGTIAPSLVVTGDDGRADSIFTSGTKSGEVQLTGNVIFPWGSSNNHTTLYIDHDVPYTLNWFDAPTQAFVGDNVTIKVHYCDIHNNSIDNRRFTENVTFSVTSPSVPNATIQAAFWNGTAFTPSLSIPLDSSGVATGLMRMDIHPGTNRITVHPQFSGVSDKVITIEGTAESIPVIIEQQISSYSVPDPYPNIPADGVNVFTILYTLRDQYGNGVKNAHFWMNTSPLGESMLLSTNLTGQVKVTYGPKIRTDIITITATAVTPKPDSTYATTSALVEIVATEPVQMVIMANPQLLPSWDVPGNKTAEIKAVVMDQYGNPVKNQPVSFNIGSSHYSYSSGNSPRWQENGLTSIQGNTSSHAYAKVNFIPGWFPGQGVPPEHDNCTISAQWGSYPPQTAFLQWTNVPFLSISTNVTPMVAAWNDIINVEIKVEGNGYALRPKPVDVMLVIDTSGSMAWDINHDYGSSNQRMDAAKNAAKRFIGNLNPSRDTVGLVTFSSTASLKESLTTDFNDVNSSITGLSASGATNMRKGFQLGIEELATHGRSDAIKALILMSDGEWNYDGSPVAHGTGWPSDNSPGYTYSFSGNNLEPNNYRYYTGLGGTLTPTCVYGCSDHDGWIDPDCTCTNWEICWHYDYYWGKCTNGICVECGSKDCYEDDDIVYQRCFDGEFTNQNMSRYASSNNVRIYDIFFASTPSSTVNTTLRTMADSTGGFYEFAPSAAKLTEIFERIAGLLREEAGVGVTMDLPFNDVTIATNTSSWSMQGKDIFNYLPYTDEWKYWSNDTTIYRNQNRDDSLNWTTTGDLSFNIGTIKLNQIWDAKYKLQVKNTTLNVGRITFFDEDSVIQFSDGKQWYSVSLPTTYLTCIGGQPQTPIGGEEVGYDLETPTIQDTIVTQTFTREFKRNGVDWNQPWNRTWYETYYISIPGCRGLTKVGQTIIPPDVPLEGSYTFDIRPYLCEGQTEIDFNFYVEGTDYTIGGGGGSYGKVIFVPGGIYIMLK